MKRATFYLLLLLPAGAVAQDGAMKETESYRPAGSFGVHIDQDFLASWKNEDRNYTQGTAFSFTRLHQERYNFLFLPINGFYFLGDFVRRKLGDGADIEVSEAPSTLSFGVSAYTPLTLRSYMPAYGDRPFSSILFLETRRNRLIGRNFHSWSFTYGAIGTNIGYDFQGWAHQKLVQNRGIPIGWPTQISNGGHFAWLVQNSMMIPLRRLQYDKLRDSDNAPVSKFGWDMAYGVQSAVGCYTYFGAQASLRVGKINPLNYMNSRTSFTQSGDKRNIKSPKPIDPVLHTPDSLTITTDTLTITTDSLNQLRGPKLKSRYWEHYAFGYGAPRLWARNSLITGQRNVPSVYALESKYLNTFVLEMEFGYTMTRTSVVEQISDDGDHTFFADRSLQITLSVKVRSLEYHYEPYTRWHYWGSVNIILPVDLRKTKYKRP